MESRRGALLLDGMRAAGMTQAELARISGVRQPSISQFISGKVELSDDMLARLLACMGYALEVERRAVKPRQTRSVRRSWLLHRALARHLTPELLREWTPKVVDNLSRLRTSTQGEPHQTHLLEWADLVEAGDVAGMRRIMTGLDVHSVEMREVSPLGGLLSQDERREALGGAA